MTGSAIITPTARKRRWRRIRIAAAVVVAVCLAAVGVLAAWVMSMPPLPLEQARRGSITVVDRHGKLLRAYATADGRWRLLQR